MQSLTVEAPCSGQSSFEYAAIHNEAWILIEGTANVNGNTQLDASCQVNDCQTGQRKQGGKCIPCIAGENNCETCVDGYVFLVSTCILNQLFKEIGSSTKWRVWTPLDHAPK